MNKADLEFYYGGIVRRLAIAISPYETEEEWEKTSYRTKCHWLDMASKSVLHLLVDEDFSNLMSNLAANAANTVLARFFPVTNKEKETS